MISPLQRTKKKEHMREEDLITIHHNMMVVYGWIPLEEFKKLPFPTLLSLYREVEKELTKREQIRLFTMSAGGAKNPK